MNGYNETSKNSKTNEAEKTSNIESPKKIRYLELKQLTLHADVYRFISIISIYWDYAISINMASIVYLHCHQHSKTLEKFESTLFVRLTF